MRDIKIHTDVDESPDVLPPRLLHKNAGAPQPKLLHVVDVENDVIDQRLPADQLPQNLRRKKKNKKEGRGAAAREGGGGGCGLGGWKTKKGVWRWG